MMTKINWASTLMELTSNGKKRETHLTNKHKPEVEMSAMKKNEAE